LIELAERKLHVFTQAHNAVFTQAHNAVFTQAQMARKRIEFFQKLPNLMKSNTEKFLSVFKSVSRTSSVPHKMVWSRDDRSVTAEQPEDIVNLLNDYFHSTFKSRLCRAEYVDHPSTKTMTI
jgi:hypothetical protein